MPSYGNVSDAAVTRIAFSAYKRNPGTWTDGGGGTDRAGERGTRTLLFEERIFTGYSGLYTLRILPPLILSTKEVDIFVGSLKKVLDGYYENSR